MISRVSCGDPVDDPNSSHRRFEPTRWSLVAAAAGTGAAEPTARAALEELCRGYWYPLYAYVRRRGTDADAARDLVQAFFLRLLETGAFAAADPARGKFRTFLLTALTHFQANEWRRDHALKRGGGRAHLSLDFDAGEGRYAREAAEPADRDTPESLFERRWAMALLARATDRLRRDQMAGDRPELGRRLIAVLAGESDASYAAVGAACGTTEGAVKVAAHRLRARYRELLRAEVAQTLADGESVDDELRALFEAVGN